MPSHVSTSRSNTGGRKTIPQVSSAKENSAMLQPSRKGRERRPSEKLAAQINAHEDAAREKADQVRRHTEREKKAQHQNQVGSDADENVYERPNNTFTSQVVPSKPAALVQRTNKVPPASTRILQDEYNGLDTEHMITRHKHGRRVFETPSRSPSPGIQDHRDHDSLEEEERHGTPMSPSRPLPDLSESPAVQYKRKHHDSSDSESEDSFTKAQKITHHHGRPRARDYEDVAKDLILQAAAEYRCLLSCQDAFPDLASEAEMVKTAWEEVNNKSGLAPMGLTSDIAKIIKARGSQARGEMKDKTKALVEAFYGFDSGRGRMAIASNRQWAEELKHERGFVYKTIVLDSEGKGSERKGMYQHPIIQKAVNVMWFQNKRDEGIQFRNMFKPIPIAAIALVLTAIEANIDEWVTGVRVPVTFWADDYRPVYHSHIDGLKKYGLHTSKHDLLGRLQRVLYNYGCHHAGVAPTEDNRLPAVPVSAYEAALREYEEDSETDDEGSMVMD